MLSIPLVLFSVGDVNLLSPGPGCSPHRRPNPTNNIYGFEMEEDAFAHLEEEQAPEKDEDPFSYGYCLDEAEPLVQSATPIQKGQLNKSDGELVEAPPLNITQLRSRFSMKRLVKKQTLPSTRAARSTTGFISPEPSRQRFRSWSV